MAQVRQTVKKNKFEDVFHASEEKFRVLADVTSLAVFIYQDGRLKYVNPAAVDLTGYSPDELVAMNSISLFPDSTKEKVRGWGLELQKGKPGRETIEVAILTREGEERWVVLNATVMDYEGKPAWMGTAFDITERKRSELLQDAVYRIAQAADRSQNLEDLFPAVHAIVGEVMTASNFYIALRDDEKNLIFFPYYVDEYDTPAKASPPEKGLTEYVLRTGKSLLCDSNKQASLERAGEVELVGTACPIWLGVPLFIDKQVIGIMVVQDYHNSDAFGEQEQRVFEFVSSQIAMAINRKRTEDALREKETRVRRRVDELAALYETARDISGQHNLLPLLQTIVERAALLLGSPSGSIYLMDREHEALEMVVTRGLEDYIGLRIKVGQGVSGEVVNSLVPVIENDYQHSRARLDVFNKLPITAVLSVPMLHSGELMGVLTLCQFAVPNREQERAYTQADVELLTLFSGSAASAVHNTRLYEETRQRLVELELLHQASLSSAQIQNLRAVAQRILDTLEKMLNWKGSIWIIEHHKPVLQVLSITGLTGAAHRERLNRVSALIPSIDDSVIGQVCKNGRVVRVGSVSTDPDFVTLDPNTKSELCVPLIVGGRTIGCINVESEIPEAFSEHDERLLITLANQAAVTIENMRLFEDTRQRAARQTALNAIITASARTDANLIEILNIALDQTLMALGLDIGAVWLSWSLYSVQQMTVRGLPQSLNATMSEAVLSGNRDLISTTLVDDWQLSRLPSAELYLSMGIISTIAIPLLTKDKRLGGLTIALLEARQWTQEEIAFIEAIGREVGLAAERARLFEQTSNRLTELEAVNKVSTSLRAAQSLQEILKPLIDETLRALLADAGAIWLYNQKQEKLVQEIGRGWCIQAGQIEFGQGEDLPVSVWRSGDIHFSNDLAMDPHTSAAMRAIVPQGQSAVCIPIRAELETIGVLLVTAPLPHDFTGDDGRVLVTLTEIAGSAIHRMRLTDQLINHAAELELRVTERTAELQSALQKAQAADRLKSEFIINVNHELRTPLTNLVLYYQMLRTQPTVKMEERLDVIGRELQRLRNLIEDLLNLSRFDLGQVPFRPAMRDLNSLVQPLVSDRTPLAEERGLTLYTEFQPGLEQVPYDEPMIVQVVSNLLTNALNYTPAGGSVLVKTANEKKNEEVGVSFWVQDTGPGIDAEDLPHLFERFYRGKSGHQSGAPGTGLGLSIVKQVVEYHRGKLEVHNRTDGNGSIFSIWLPVKQK